MCYGTCHVVPWFCPTFHLALFMCQGHTNRQGRIQDFLKEGAPTLRVYRTLAPVWTGVSEGDVPPQKRRKTAIFKVNSHDLVHSFCLEHPHKVRRLISAKNRGGARRVRPPLNPPLIGAVKRLVHTTTGYKYIFPWIICTMCSISYQFFCA